MLGQTWEDLLFAHWQVPAADVREHVPAGLEVDTFIIKTVSILPQPELKGLGTALVASAQQRGREMGFRRCIHALMFEDNISLNISRHYADVMRKYTLYSKDLAK